MRARDLLTDIQVLQDDKGYKNVFSGVLCVCVCVIIAWFWYAMPCLVVLDQSNNGTV